MEPSTFILTLLHTATGAQLLHWQAKSFAAHEALGELYESLPGAVDRLVEVYQGRRGVVTGYGGGFKPPADAVKFVRAIVGFVDENRGILGGESEVQNLVDEVQAHLTRALYRLENLS